MSRNAEAPPTRLLCRLIVPVVLVATIHGTSSAGDISSLLTSELDARAPGQTVPIFVTLTDQVDLTQFTPGRSAAEPMIRELQAKAAATQPALLDFLDREAYQGRVKRFWITNAVALDGTPELVGMLAGRDDVALVDFDAPGRGPDVEVMDGVESRMLPSWSIDRIRADEVWSIYGYDGTGIVVGSMDTGFDPNHEALAGKWRGGANSWTDIINGLTSPYDDHGHGTHTIGTMVGGDGDGPLANDVGVAYGAQFISAKVLDQFNSFCCLSVVVDGAQWMLDPDGNPGTNDFPHVINNSWYFFSQGYTGFYATANAWRTAGIIPVFCQGNEGPASQSTRSPGDYNNVFGVGGTDISESYYDFTSRGPSPLGSSFPADRRKPDVSAPGEVVPSCVPGGGYQSWSGTSMATPHVAGTAALMLQANPTLAYDQIMTALRNTAVDLGDPGYDYIFGYGRIDAFEAVTSAIVAVGDPGSAARPGLALTLRPNPFRSRVVIGWDGSDVMRGRLSIFDPAGRLVRTMDLDGAASATWDGRNQGGVAVAPGTYFVRLEADGARVTERALVVR